MQNSLINSLLFKIKDFISNFHKLIDYFKNHGLLKKPNKIFFINNLLVYTITCY